MKPKLLIIELWGVGDLVIATPFLRAASEKYDVTLVAKPYALDLQPRLWPKVKVLSSVAPWTSFKRKYWLYRWPWVGLFRLMRQLRAQRFDFGLSARWDPRDHFLLTLAGVRRRLGFPRAGSGLYLNQPVPRPGNNAHRYEYWCALANALDLKLPAREAIPVPLAPRGKILIHTGAGQTVRVWPLERFRAVVRRLREQGFAVQVACDPDQRGWWLAMAELNVATPLTITDLLRLTDAAGLFIGNDSGPGHLAATVGVPTFTIFGPQLPERFAPLNPAAEWIEGWACPHRPCSDYCRFALTRCLWDLSEETTWPRIRQFVTRHEANLVTRAPVPTLTGDKFQTARPLRLLQIFNQYLMPGGEENSVARIAAHLELAGHQITRYWRASAEWNLPDAPARWRQLFLTWNNPAVLNQLREVHEKTKPDAWVLHNLVPVVSLGVYRLAQELGVPIIHWLHNYRPISPSGALRAGERTLKPDDRFLAWKEVWSGSWRGRFLTAWLALGYARIKRRGDFNTVKAWIALSGEMKRIFERAGFPPPEKLHALRHSWDIQPSVATASDDGYFLFLGRMIEDKGVKFLVELWQRPEFRNVPLVMAGEGPLADFYRNHTPPNIRWVGFVRGEAKRRLVADCRAVLFPCLWTEPLGMVVYEAYEQGRPVLASDLGGLKDMITDGQTGRLIEPGNQLAWVAALQPFIEQPEMSRQMGERGRQWLNENVSPAAWNRQFDEIIRKALP